MTAESFLSRCLLLDLELGRDQKIYRMGAVLGDAALDREGPMGASALSALDAFGAGADFVLGHNVARHDLPFLQGLAPDLAILRKPMVDTLFLSPLAFPEYPYHRLVKDYKLVRDTVSDPVADARLAAQLFRDEWAVFAARIEGGEGHLVEELGPGELFIAEETSEAPTSQVPRPPQHRTPKGQFPRRNKYGSAGEGAPKLGVRAGRSALGRDEPG